MKSFMKSKNYTFLSLFVALLMSVGAVSCSSNINDPKIEEQPEQEAQKSSISFRLALPQGGKVTYAPARSIHDEAEWHLESLYMYVFDANTGNIVGAAKNIVGDLQAVSGEEATWNYVHEYDPAKDTGVYRFAFVANENPGAVQNEAELLAKLASKELPATGAASKNLLDAEKNIPMTGYAFQGNRKATDIALSSTVANAKVELTRIVARIDVQNNARGFEIKEIKVLRTNAKSNLFVKKDANGVATYEAPNGADRVDLEGFAPVPAAGIAQGGELKKAFYLYEGQQPQDLAEATTVEIKGTFSGKNITVLIPFVRSSEAISTPVTVKRNHLYNIKIGGIVDTVDGAKVKFSIEDTPWNGVLLNDSFDAITFGRSFGSFNLRWSPSHKVLIIGTEFPDTKYVASVESHYKDHATFEFETSFPDGIEWCDVTYKNGKNGKGSFTLKIKDSVSVVANNGNKPYVFAGGKDKVRVVLTIWSNADSAYKTTFTCELRNITISKDPNILIGDPDTWHI